MFATAWAAGPPFPARPMHWLAAFLLASTMLVAIVGQQWGNGMWQMLPAAGFLWRALLLKAIGSGRFGLDALITTRQRR